MWNICGIIGHIDIRNAAPVLHKGLKNLEYMSYDSCGIACINNNIIDIKKDAGNIYKLLFSFRVF